MNLEQLKTVYFVGIGGIGMSAIARYFNGLGIAVYGYDRVETTLTKKLVEEGMSIHYEEDLSAIPANIDLVVYTPAVPDRHLELQHFRSAGLPIMKRAEVLGLISRSKRTIGVAGTHGKTTTSSLLTYLLREGGVDCTAFLGGIVKDFGSNFVSGSSDWVVVEADEYDRSFLHLSPDLAVILSMDADHLDIYGDSDAVREEGFLAFAAKIKAGGRLWVQDDWKHFFKDRAGTRYYGLAKGQYRAENVRVEKGYFVFDYISPDLTMRNLQTSMPGRHNVENATAAISLALAAGADTAAIRGALASFKGIGRRFELVYRGKQCTYIDDYAHHPSELTAAIGAARELFPDKKLTGIFQPHLYSRTRDFVDGFAEALDGLDEVILLDIYPARELPIKGISSEMIFDRMLNPKKKCIRKENLLAILEPMNLEILLSLGAGDIGAEVEKIKNLLIHKEN